MNQLKTHASIMVLLGSLGLAACGGGGSSSETGTQSSNDSGMDTTVGTLVEGEGSVQTTSGVITRFGSVFVNGVEYATDGAVISMDGVQGGETDLAVGMVVEVEGSVNADGLTGTASQINFADVVEGYVLDVGISLNTGKVQTLNVMGQHIIVTGDTLFASNNPNMTSIDNIAQGSIVEVSGFADGSGDVYATRIEVKLFSNDIEVKGVVSGLNPQTFELGGLTVDYSSAVSVPPGLSDGMYVEVKVDGMPTDNGNGYLASATMVEVEDDGQFGIQGAEGENVEIRGVVAAGPDGNTFQLNGQTVAFSSDAFEDGYGATDMLVGVFVDLQAHFDADGVLVADQLEIAAQGTAYEGYVAAVDKTEQTVTLRSQASWCADCNGDTYQITHETIMVDERDKGGYVTEHYFDLSDLAAGDFVEIKADGTLALRLRRLNEPAATY